MLENTKSNKRLNFYVIINIVLGISMISGLSLSWFLSSRLGDSNTVPLSSMASLFRFLTGNHNRMVLDIVLHNLSIATLGLILSFLSYGVLGFILLFFNSFVLGVILYQVHNFYTVLFVLLELLGICISVFGGTSLAKKRFRDNLPLSVVLKYSLFLFLGMTVIYLCAASIETSLIISRWR